MLNVFLEFCVLAAIIVAAGTVLTRCADAFAEITGEFSSNDLLGRIFSSFCIGK